MTNQENILEKIVALSKRRGFFYPTSDIYRGLNGIWDKGPLGTILSRNIENFWIEYMKNHSPAPLLLFDGAIIGSREMWKASGHVDSFSDPLVDCLSCNIRVRADEISLDKPCERCGNKKWSEIRKFNMMFQTSLGAMQNTDTICYLRPETAQTIFSQFKNIMNTNRVKIPFGIMQIGKAFRNEITPRHFLFRSREFSQMEMEFFCHPDDAPHFFKEWINIRYQFFKKLGITSENIRLYEHKKEDLSHYSAGTFDVEYKYPFGWKEIEGIAYRTNFDLKSHEESSKKNMSVYNEKSKQSYIPHVIETSVGVERLLLLLLCHGYREEREEDSVRIYLLLPFVIAPVQIAIFPLSKNEEVYAMKIKQELSHHYRTEYDNTGSIGKRYRRQDEIGTPYCISIDEQSLTDQTVTVRYQETMTQTRISTNELLSFFTNIKN